MSTNNLGHVTAYAYAKSKGYTGTEEQFAQLMADFAGAANTAVEAAEEAEGYRDAAAGSASSASTSAGNAQDYQEAAAASAQEAEQAAADARAYKGSPLVAATAAEMTDTDHTYVYTGSEDGYTAGNWYYYDGASWTSGGVYNSAAVQTDTTLSVHGVAADAAAAGEVKSAVSDISSTTSNLFDPTTIIIGKNATGTSGYPKRALSGAMHVGANKAKIKVLSIPANLKFEIDFYESDVASTRKGTDSNNGWITATGTYTYSYSYEYIRFLFANVDNSNLSPSDFTGFKVQVNAGEVTYEYEPFLTAKDSAARRDIDGVIGRTDIFGLLPLKGYVNGTYNSSTGQIDYSATRIISDFVEVEPASVLIGKTVDLPGIRFRVSVVCFDEDKDYVKDSNYSALFSGYKLGGSTKYVRFVMAKSDGNDFLDIVPEDAVSAQFYVGYSGNSLQPSNLKVMTFNVGKWNYGSTAGIPSASYSEKLLNYRRFFGEQDCDVVGLQEFDRLIDDAQTIDARDALFYHWYQNSEISGSWEAVFSKYPISGGGTHQIWVDRYYVDTYMQFGEKVIYLLNVHLSPGHDGAAKTTRASQAQDVINLLAGHDDFILFGDFNPEPDEYETLFGLFADAGYNIANAGFFGDFWTWSTDRDDFETDTPSGTVYVIDNIITSANIKINSVKKVNTYSELTSDHIPIIAELSI